VVSNEAFKLAELIPLGMVIALSPFTIIPAILMLHTPRPRPTSLAFLAGWVVSIAGITAAFVVASDLVGSLNAQPGWAPYLRIAVGGVADRPVARDFPLLQGSALADALNDWAWQLQARDEPQASAALRRQLVRHLGRRVAEQAQADRSARARLVPLLAGTPA
jgi:hypothetical protein